MITKEEKKEFLVQVIKDIKKEIIICGLNVRYLERSKLSAKESDLNQLEANLRNWKMTEQGLKEKLEVAEDELAGK